MTLKQLKSKVRKIFGRDVKVISDYMADLDSFFEPEAYEGHDMLEGDIVADVELYYRNSEEEMKVGKPNRPRMTPEICDVILTAWRKCGSPEAMFRARKLAEEYGAEEHADHPDYTTQAPNLGEIPLAQLIYEIERRGVDIKPLQFDPKHIKPQLKLYRVHRPYCIPTLCNVLAESESDAIKLTNRKLGHVTHVSAEEIDMTTPAVFAGQHLIP